MKIGERGLDSPKQRVRFPGLALAIACLLVFAAPVSALASMPATVKTADEFKQAVGEGSNSVTVAGDFELDSLVELPAGSDITLTGSGTITAGKQGGLYVPATSTLTLDGEKLVLDGGGNKVVHSVPLLWCRGALKFKAGTVRNFVGGNYSSDMRSGFLSFIGVSAVSIEGGSGNDCSFVMDGGSIEHNATTGANYGGGGVVLVGDGATMTLNAGSISNNSAQRSDANDAVLGGGILLMNGPALTMNGGSISNNVAGSRDFGNDAIGGGIAAMGLGSASHIVMNGGEVSNNKALSGVKGGHGGGIGTTTITTFVAKGGSVTGNETTGMGGGLYVDGAAATKDGTKVSNNRFYNTVVTNNTAKSLGGGLWICPTGYGRVNVTHGAAIYGNAAGSGVGAAGDDFVVHPHAQRDYTVTLANRMLGGGAAAWYADGGVQANTPTGSPNDTADPNVSRYDASNPGKSVVLNDDNGPHALKNVTDSGAEGLARKFGTFTVSDNTALVGGGIATNQMISFGGDDDGSNTDYSLTVRKAWDASIAESERVEVGVNLTVGGVRVDSAKLNADNGWAATFSNLPMPDGYEDNGTPYLLDKDGNRLDFGIEEEDGDWAVSVGNWVASASSHTLSVTVTNSAPAPAEVPLVGTKSIEGRSFKSGDSFMFELEGLDGAPSFSCGDSVTIKPSSGTTAQIDFGTAKFTKAGTYTYHLRERKGAQEGMSYDVAERTVVVKVASNGKGKLEASVAYYVGDKASDGLSWTNRYGEETPAGSDKTPGRAHFGGLPKTGDAAFATVILFAALGVAIAFCGLKIIKHK